MGPRAGVDRCGKSRPPPGFDPRTVQPVVSRYTDYATLPTFLQYTSLIRRAGKIAKTTISSVMSICVSVRPHGSTRLPLGGFPQNLIFEYFSKLCRKIKISLQLDKNNVRVLYVATCCMYVHDNISLNYLYNEMFQIKIVKT